MTTTKTERAKRLLVMAGGTGGHIFPGLAVAHALQAEGWEVRWLGTADRMEATLVPQHGIEIDFIHISGLRGKGIKALLNAPLRITKAVIQARKIIKAYQPDVVLGMGGYVSGPGGLAAKLCGVPIVLHEQNGIAGVTNKLLSKIATTVLQAFPTAFKNAEVVGNPVRQDVIALPAPAERFAKRTGPLNVLVMGGSQGARIINTTMPLVARELKDKVTIWHQVGKNNVDGVSAAYQEVASKHRIEEFIDDVAGAYAWADIVICRSGALTVSEIAVAGLPAIFIPFMHKDRQQYWNGKWLEDAGAAKIIEQPELSSKKIVELLDSFDREQLLTMANQARAVALPKATERVAELINALTQ